MFLFPFYSCHLPRNAGSGRNEDDIKDGGNGRKHKEAGVNPFYDNALNRPIPSLASIHMASVAITKTKAKTMTSK